LGYGSYKTGEKTIHVFDLGYAKEGEVKGNWEKIMFPNDNSSNNKLEWSGLENPDPLPAGTIKPLGFPISILLYEQISKVISTQVTNAKGEEIDCFVINPENDINNKQFNAIILVPKKVLIPESKYTVMVKVKLGSSNTERSYSWNFVTQK